MDRHKEGLIFFIVILLVAIFLNLKFMGFATLNDTTSEVTIRPANSPPTITDYKSSVEVCEGSALFYLFNATDPDDDRLWSSIVPNHNLFTTLLWDLWDSYDPDIQQFLVFSGGLDKSVLLGVNTAFRSFLSNISVDDQYNSSCCYDKKQINITVIEKNNAPVVEDLGVRTIWTRGVNSTFYEDWDVYDEEYDRGYGSLTYTIRIVNSSGTDVSLFNITSLGVMSFTANDTTPLGVYTINVCVQDTGLTNTHINISSVCGQSGASFKVCDNFTLTVTDENRPPEFLDYYPVNLSFTNNGGTSMYFNITKYDPDGTIPDAYWFVDGIFKEIDSGSSVDEYYYNFGCGTSGEHNVSVEITDGLLNETLSWIINVNYVSCIVPPPSSSSSSSSSSGPGPAVVKNFVVEPDFITTSIFQQQGKSFDLIINNTGGVSLNFTLFSENISDMAILSEEKFVLGVGKGKIVKLYLYSLSDTSQGVYFGDILIKGDEIEKRVKIVLEVKEREPLFDIKVSVPKEFKYVLPGDNMNVIVDMLNVGLYGTAVDVELYLFMANLDKVLFYERQKEVIAVETNISVDRDMFVPLNTPPGTYLIMGEAKYGNITVTTFDTFTVGEKKYVRASYFLIIAIVLALIILILFILYKRRKKKKDED